MTEVTRVPLQPIEKGSLTKLWLGVIVAILLAGGIAWAAVPKGIEVNTLVEGSGPTPEIGDVVFVKYVGTLPDGSEFDRSQDVPLPIPGIFPEGNPFPITEGATIEGFFEALQQVRKGGKYEIFIPAEKAYGDAPQAGSPIPPGSDLTFELEVVDFMSEEDFQRRLGVLQQMMQQNGAAMGQGAPPQGQ